MMPTDFQYLPAADYRQLVGNRLTRSATHRLLLIEATTEPSVVQIDFFAHRFEGSPFLVFVSANRALQIDSLSAASQVILFSEAFLPLSDPAAQGAFVSIHYNYFCHSPFVRLTPDQLTTIDNGFREIARERNPDGLGWEAVRSQLRLLLIRYQRFIKAGTLATVEPQRYERVITLRKDIEQFFRQHQDVPFYAERQAVTPKHLNGITKQALGRTVGTLIHERILLEAKRLLSLTPLSVKEIAYQVGFEDPAYFHRFFKTHVGLTPESFRRQGRFELYTTSR